MGARVCVTGHWRARGCKAAQSGESVTEWLLVAHTVRVLTAAPSVHGVRSVLDAARRGTMSAPAAAAALVYAADAEGSEAAAAEGSEGGEGVAALVTEYAARDEPSAEQAPLGARDERVVEELLRQLRAALPPAIARLAIATDGQRPVLKAASAEMQPDAISLAEVREEMQQLGGRLGAVWRPVCRGGRVCVWASGLW